MADSDGITSAHCKLQASQPVGDGSRVVDVLLEWPDGRVAVEVDGPSHFLEDADGERSTLTTGTLLRNRTLEQWGLTVVSIHLEGPNDIHTASFAARVAAQLRAAGVPVYT
jgi:very-short-patch-repair endonuclease